MKKYKKIFIALTISIISLCVVSYITLGIVTKIEYRDGNYELAEKCYSISYSILKRNSDLEGKANALFKMKDLNGSVECYLTLLKKDYYVKNESDAYSIALDRYTKELIEKGERDKYKKVYSEVYKLNYDNIVTLTVLLNNIKNNEKLQKDDLNFLVEEYQKLMKHPKINENNHFIGIEGALVDLYRKLGETEMADKYRDLLVQQIEELKEK